MTNKKKRDASSRRSACRRLLPFAFAVLLWSTAPADDGTAWPTHGWETTTPAAAGMKESLLKEARNYALTGGGSGMITRSGRQVYAWGNTGTRFDLKSSSKSIGVTALGLALQDGLVSLSDKAKTHLPSVGLPPQGNAGTGWLGDISLLNLATHTAGFDKPGGYVDILFKPGTAWSYSDGGANWLADVLTVRYGEDLKGLLFDRVFDPLGIRATDLTWRTHRYRDTKINGIERREFGSGFDVDVDAMARIGYLYLRQGAWDGRRILPPGFVATASRPVPGVVGLPVTDTAEHAGASSHYGLLWWNNGDRRLANVPADAFWSWGLHDSLIIVVPSLDIVVARAGDGWRSGWDSNYSVLEPFLEPIARAVNGITLSRPPVVQIDAPDDGVTRAAGSAVTFAGRATDADDGNLAHGLTWISNRDGTIGTGASFATTTLSAGTHVITASVADSGGLLGATNVVVTIGGGGGGGGGGGDGDGAGDGDGGGGASLPAVADTYVRRSSPGANAGGQNSMRVEGPGDKLGFVQFDLSSLHGAVASAALKLHVREVSQAGTLNVHAALAAWSESSLTYRNQPPFAASPAASAAVSTSDAGRVLSLDVTELVRQWVASPGTAFGLVLDSATVDAEFGTREGGQAASLEIGGAGGANAAPVVTITKPSDHATFAQGESVRLVGKAEDAEEGDLRGSLSWSSSRDGLLGSGRALSVTTLSPGAHVITASVTDSAGAPGFDSIEVVIGTAGGGPTVTLPDIADTFANKGRPDANFGGMKVMRAHGPNDKKVSFIEFDRSDLGDSVSSATLELFVKDVRKPGVLEVRAVLSGWGERDLTYRTMPAYGAVVASLPLSQADNGRTVTIDVTGLVQQWAASANPVFGIALTGDGLHGIFHTREGENPPVIEVRQN